MAELVFGSVSKFTHSDWLLSGTKFYDSWTGPNTLFTPDWNVFKGKIFELILTMLKEY